MAIYGATIDEPSEFRLYAMECISLADETANAKLRKRLFKMAEHWMKAAAQAERRPQHNRSRITEH
jgi:hypothetical protein